MTRLGRALILDLQSGISGDMFVAAAASLAGCEEEVLRLPERLGFQGVRCEFRTVQRGGLSCRKFDVIVGDTLAENAAPSLPRVVVAGGIQVSSGGESGPTPDPEPVANMKPLTGAVQVEVEGDTMWLDVSQVHAQPHAHRPLSEIQALIGRAALEPPVRDRALRLFERLGQVEADAHGIPLEHVQFHEVGAIDSIVDIVAAALCIERLGLGAVFSTPICVGKGTVRTAHGMLPVPAPATEKLLQGMPVYAGELSGEWTTPTGALILAELKPQFSDPVLTVTASALGGGGKDTPKRPNLLRLRLAEAEAPRPQSDAFVRDELVALYSNIDDSTGELLGADLIELLLRSGARDALLHSVVMKKGRPGLQLEVLVEPDRAERLAGVILAHTSTIGVRLVPVRRLTLPREAATVSTPFGEIAVKRVRLPDGTRRTTPEYEACRAAAAQHGVPVQTVYRAVARCSDSV